jgi:hypothetical protein
MNNEVAFLYVKFKDIDFILPLNHNDCENLTIDLSQSKQNKKVFNKKGLLQSNLNISDTYDIQSEQLILNGQIIDVEPLTEGVTNFYHRMGVRINLGKIIPIMKWIEILPTLIKDVNFTITENYICSTMIPILSRIERRGIRVDRKKFIDKWPSATKQLNDDIVYTEYNPYTSTSRPSNRHGGINYAALKKSDGTRKIFLPRKDKMFLQFDYDAYHVRIIGKLVNYDLPKTSVHQWLADQYGCSYADSKGKTFKILYGGVTEEYMKIPFFKKVDDYIKDLWIEGETVGYIKTPKGQKIWVDRIEKPTPAKIFNYLLQALETECNVEVMNRLEKIGIDSMNLYLYDSFLFEYDSNGSTDEAKKIRYELESLGFPVKATWGTDYDKV